MDRSRGERGLVAAGGRARRLHPLRFLAQYRSHFAAVLIVLAAGPIFAADGIAFDPKITLQEFETFSRLLAQGIFATPVQPARASGFLGFDAGVAATMVKVDRNASYWQRAVPPSSDFTRSGYVALPRLVVAKGFGAGTVALSYAKISNSGIATYGGSLDVPIIRGTLVTPELALRGSYATLSGVDVLNLKTYGLELFLSKGFGPIMPYAAIGKMRSDARAPAVNLADRANINRYTAGLRLSLLLPKIAIEATRAQVTSYAAKISVGF